MHKLNLIQHDDTHFWNCFLPSLFQYDDLLLLHNIIIIKLSTLTICRSNTFIVLRWSGFMKALSICPSLLIFSSLSKSWRAAAISPVSFVKRNPPCAFNNPTRHSRMPTCNYGTRITIFFYYKQDYLHSVQKRLKGASRSNKSIWTVFWSSYRSTIFVGNT